MALQSILYSSMRHSFSVGSSFRSLSSVLSFLSPLIYLDILKQLEITGLTEVDKTLAGDLTERQ